MWPGLFTDEILTPISASCAVKLLAAFPHKRVDMICKRVS